MAASAGQFTVLQAFNVLKQILLGYRYLEMFLWLSQEYYFIHVLNPFILINLHCSTSSGNMLILRRGKEGNAKLFIISSEKECLLNNGPFNFQFTCASYLPFSHQVEKVHTVMLIQQRPLIVTGQTKCLCTLIDVNAEDT